jgi:hypothetical protein
MNPFQSLAEYERFIYTLQGRYSSIRSSTLTVIRRGAAAARLTGELEIGDYRIVVREKRILITNTFLPTSNTTASPRLNSLSPSPTCLS